MSLIGPPKRFNSLIVPSVSSSTVLFLFSLNVPFLGNDSGSKLKALTTEYEELQADIIKKDTALTDAQNMLTKIQTAPVVSVGECLGRDFFYSKTKSPDELIREIMSHISDYHRVQ